LLHAAGVPADLRVHIGEPRQVEEHPDALVQYWTSDPEEPSGETKELLGLHPLVEAGHIGQEADLCAYRVADRCDVAAEYLRGAAGGTREAGQNVQSRRLAGAIRAEEPEDRALLNDQVNGVKSMLLAIDLGQPSSPDRGTHRGSAPSRGP
jgi:hypothetical protein